MCLAAGAEGPSTPPKVNRVRREQLCWKELDSLMHRGDFSAARMEEPLKPDAFSTPKMKQQLNSENKSPTPNLNSKRSTPIMTQDEIAQCLP